LTSLDEVVARRKEGQTQIFFISGAGQTKEQLEKSPFVERILARGYEVLYFSDPVDEMVRCSFSLLLPSRKLTLVFHRAVRLLGSYLLRSPIPGRRQGRRQVR
jgi:hypothetical protein